MGPHNRPHVKPSPNSTRDAGSAHTGMRRSRRWIELTATESRRQAVDTEIEEQEPATIQSGVARSTDRSRLTGEDHDIGYRDAFLQPFLELGSVTAQMAASTFAHYCRYLRALAPQAVRSAQQGRSSKSH